jgi:hypothetical protein
MKNYQILTSFQNLIPLENYSYQIESMNGNWPVTATPISGSFVPMSESHDINTNIKFCISSGVCTGPNLLPYAIGLCSLDNIPFTELRVKLNLPYSNQKIYSKSQRVECSECLLVTTVHIPAKATLTATSGNVRNFNVVASGLKPYSDYVYSLKNFSTNHLIGVKELSGTISTKNATSVSIPNSLIFCESSGYCNGYVTTGVANSNVCNNLLSSSFRLELNSSCLAAPVVSDKIEVECDNCLPVVNVSLPTSISTLTSTNLISITGSATNLKPFQSYSYYFTGDNNWPVVLDNVSGSFVSKTTSENIVTKLLFCSPSGSCVNENGLLPHTLNSSAQKMLNNNNLYSKLKLNITPTYCNNIIYSSNVANINCKDCLPCIRYANILFQGSPTIILDTDCCVGQKLLRVNVTNSVPGDRYTYQFDSPSGVGVNSIVFNPSSGEIYFGSGGTGSINTICNIDLIDRSQTIINCELTHTDTSNKVMDTIVLACNNSSC